MDVIKQQVRDFITQEIYVDASPDEIQDTTNLLDSGILDSLSTLRLVEFLEQTYQIKIAPHELSEDYISTINQIADLVRSKK